MPSCAGRARSSQLSSAVRRHVADDLHQPSDSLSPKRGRVTRDRRLANMTRSRDPSIEGGDQLAKTTGDIASHHRRRCPQPVWTLWRPAFHTWPHSRQRQYACGSPRCAVVVIDEDAHETQAEGEAAEPLVRLRSWLRGKCGLTTSIPLAQRRATLRGKNRQDRVTLTLTTASVRTRPRRPRLRKAASSVYPPPARRLCRRAQYG